MKQIIENAIYSYDPHEFMPIFRDGELANRNAFLAYKFGRVVNKIKTARG